MFLPLFDRVRCWLNEREQRAFRKLVQYFLQRHRFNWLLRVIYEEQKRAYYEDNVFDRMDQFREGTLAVFTLFEDEFR